MRPVFPLLVKTGPAYWIRAGTRLICKRHDRTVNNGMLCEYDLVPGYGKFVLKYKSQTSGEDGRE